MPFAWFVALRYLRDAKGQTALILAAVSLGVGVVVFLSALISGLEISLIDKTLGSQAHVTLERPREAPRPLVFPTPERAIARVVQPSPQRLRSIDRWPLVVADVERIEGVTAVSPMILGSAFAVRSDAKESIVVRGIEPERYVAIVDVRRKMVAGRFDVSAGVVVGASLARLVGASVGDKLRVRTPEGIEDVVTIAGVFSLGNEAVDKSWVFTSLPHAQSLYALPGGATTIELKVAELFSAEQLALDLRGRTGLEANSWMTINAELLSALDAQRNSKNLIQVFVVLAVALGIASVLIVSVVQKAREIGILRAVGTSARRVLSVFLIQGAVLGFGGALLGAAMGAGLAKAFELIARDPSGAPKVPVVVDGALVASALSLATLVGLLAALVPARRAARIDPATAIRNG